MHLIPLLLTALIHSTLGGIIPVQTALCLRRQGPCSNEYPDNPKLFLDRYELNAMAHNRKVESFCMRLEKWGKLQRRPKTERVEFWRCYDYLSIPEIYPEDEEP
ncbi:Dihydrodipicolinate synthase [Lasiodiplodia theobromae]|uniref:Dihydrodipicolinate synthase n=1 Tax=Lasiodiplodia theobromae TaxID=45133 RepID=UPI0015C36BD2|nr:Dihydrodipicolinate synthase [Lasiodiplodia theobromae]KAF4544809.1 Dihydrodipicolinate synthase [Lasiodiplodia theobromae]